MNVNDALKNNQYPYGRVISGVADSVPPHLVNDIYKTEQRLIGNDPKRIYGKFSPNINEEIYFNPITHRRETIRGGVNYFRGDEKYVNNALTWQKLPSAQQINQNSINFINRINHYGNNEQSKERIREAIRELNRKLAKKEISFDAYQAQKQAYENQMANLNAYINNGGINTNNTDELWTKQNKTSLWKMFRAIRNLEWENDYVLDQVNKSISSGEEAIKFLTEAKQQVDKFGEQINDKQDQINELGRLINENTSTIAEVGARVNENTSTIAEVGEIVNNLKALL